MRGCGRPEAGYTLMEMLVVVAILAFCPPRRCR